MKRIYKMKEVLGILFYSNMYFYPKKWICCSSSKVISAILYFALSVLLDKLLQNI